jgi:hypothetical protein
MGIMSPAARILELRRKGHKIETRKSEVLIVKYAEQMEVIFFSIG